MYILASDYDGTLNYHGISQRNREAIRRFREAGNLFGVVTGRGAEFFQLMQKQELELDFILALNGAITVTACGTEAGKITRAELIENGGVVRGVAELVGKKYGAWLSCVTIAERRTFHAGFPEGNAEYLPLHLADEPAQFTHLNTQCATEEEARRCTKEINERFGERINALQNGVCIDIPPKGVDKGEGVARFAREAGVPEDCVYCAGDHMNDIAMVSRFHGCAVENGCAELKAAAEGVYPDVAAIIEFLLAKEMSHGTGGV